MQQSSKIMFAHRETEQKLHMGDLVGGKEHKKRKDELEERVLIRSRAAVG